MATRPNHGGAARRDAKVQDVSRVPVDRLTEPPPICRFVVHVYKNF